MMGEVESWKDRLVHVGIERFKNSKLTFFEGKGSLVECVFPYWRWI